MTTTPDPESGDPADDTDSEAVAPLFEPDPDLIGWERKSDQPGEPPGR